MPTTQRRAVSVDAPSTEDEETVTSVNVDDLIRDLQAQAAKQQEHINALLAEKGIPADPVAAQIQALQQHVAAQANANPWHGDSYAALKSHVDSLNSADLTTKQSAKAVRLVSKLAKQHPGHELAYVSLLANDLHDMTLDAEDE